MANFIHKIKLVFGDKILRGRILFTLLILVLFRFMATIPIPGIDALRLEQFLSGNDFFGLLNIFSGGGLSNLSIIMLGVSPYITSSIIMQLMTVMFPKLKAMYQEEGDLGRKKFSQYSRLLTVPLALMQGFAFITLLQNQGILAKLSTFDLVTNLIVIGTGSLLLMWLGELISEFGIGNGVSLIIFAGIVSVLPSSISQLVFSFDPSQLPVYVGFLAAALVVIWGVVVITEAERPIPVTYAKQVRGNKVYGGVSTYLPLRVNQAGVIPIIFALSILLFPQMIIKFLVNVNNTIIQNISSFLLNLLNNQAFYGIAYFLLVFIFTYFYTAITFDPDSISKNLQRSGAFIPGVRPGVSTSGYIAKTLFRLTMVGALFLGVIAVLPLIVKAFTGISAVAIGGTSLLIVVSVVIDLIKKVDAQISAREY
ncbi:MAG: preprotein translocase subunit SecY [Candidatus Zambryskibacteria bacterium RIFCSPLOWO2_01_FULL_39_39]|uniref:Protein translocase subunit SecY n=1 Tax=Candidatus Zambryskibacteria bacterium RIFCSPLOWO2_01_FULL_39_39 TaxID=1802758 RepID=A0A1G2TZ01_9BACT|nr:MAG: preprotein translocase subunit SecY [Candidatus Zambryskibacteria bacterium RIFCSPHIGHO2_01_FULL_39_63]OHA94604.1 MAG: preprotein translocase subunit SecY [Candidatus Zambryskibacteria bacterium RIFCSPHIGHO2_02_FULL_39_19]OHA98055.1 MAG: preprotein translocase subunit SecY [Candidatus Zambryskibacteria bacterium RIFCSPHIGHO2_12_FULL_39_21]OHB02518.1 MAG: preprotein translocase subunit SecY [Candidatus Zambryskibacteria bacterium RIFCSPLOWO2_01_FULL_39_39]